ncbi:hypothetical protein [Xenorhabdus entomophaga]|uniref:hypothetical protein n=1 Tax=Xenorhabdus entomophaga TaxID=3136257 RepID=UPI0030F45F6F
MPMEILYGWCGKKEYTWPDADCRWYYADGRIAGSVATALSNGQNDVLINTQWDCENETLTIKRDRWSQPPLYYAADEEQVVFSSRLPHLLKLTGKTSVDIDYQCLADLIATGFISAPRTPFLGVYQLAPGAQITWVRGREQVLCEHHTIHHCQTFPVGIGFAGAKNGRVINPSLSPNVMMLNAIPYLTALTGEAYGDLGLLRLFNRLRNLHADSYTVQLNNDLLPQDFDAAKRFKQHNLSRSGHKILQKYWNEVRMPEIAEWFPKGNADSEWLWYRNLVISERQRAVTTIAKKLGFESTLYFDATNIEETLRAKNDSEIFSLEAPESGNLFFRSLKLKNTQSAINDYVNLVPSNKYYAKAKEGSSSLTGMLCAALSLNYLERFCHRLNLSF